MIIKHTMSQSSPPSRNTLPSPTPAATPAGHAPGISSAELLGTSSTLRIEHKGAVYTLRATSKGGLILTK